MTLLDLVRELGYPFRQPAIVLAWLLFWLLFLLAQRGGVLGLFLLFLIIPPACRYLLSLLEARAANRQPDPPTAEMFNLADNAWSLLPLVLAAGWVLLGVLIDSRFAGAARQILSAAVYGVAVVLGPASMATLAMTHSPLASLDPRTLYGVLRRSGPRYLLVPAALAAVTVCIDALSGFGMPTPLRHLAEGYWLLLYCTLTGAVMYRAGLPSEIDIPDALEHSPEEDRERRALQRRAVLNHAYGFISRGNRDGGLRHISDWIAGERDPDDAYRWFIDRMLRWENSDAALYLAQSWLTRLLDGAADLQAIKLTTQCLHHDPRFRPSPADRQRLIEMLGRHGRADLQAAIGR